ncbi:sugar phosphate nucleotidyltransferase [Armatimonas sp.]|uniref:sugar phosphate nucleotidyltransferase n=1 Tax=Armatimonas sp. TaxID=1872638 RepID=UPI00374D308F
MKAMILAAGEGTRLRPLTLTMPKPMVPVANTPLLVRTVELLRRQGVEQLAVNLYHKPEAIRAHFGAALTYSDEPTLLGTAGGVKKLAGFLDTTFAVLYGDNLYDFALAPLLAFHRAKNALVTIATFETPNPSACGLVISDAHGRVTRFQEKPPAAEVFTNTANAGVYILEPEVLAYIPEGAVCDFGKDIFPALLERAPGRMVALPLGGYLRDTGTPENYRQANWDLLGEQTLLLAPTARIDFKAVCEGRNILGEGCFLLPDARLRESILWRNVRVGRSATVSGAILGNNVQIGDRATVGEGAILGEGVVVAPRAIVPPQARIVADFNRREKL